ncbi:Cullin family [seawater metagenome]|uniref:Cullin family n=1 Tax=seawater metagenome TaxID=1561972 RepID=A0A5E8CLA0_9ZZZZ
MYNLIIADKFNIIKSDNAKLMNPQDFSNWIEELFSTNLGDITKYNNSLIHQYIYEKCFNNSSNRDELINLIDSTIADQVSKRAKNIVPNIKKGKFDLKHFDSMLSDMIEIMDKINKTLYLLNKQYDAYFSIDQNQEFIRLPFGKSIIFKKSFHHLYSKFVDNFVIKQFINSQILLLENTNKLQIKNFNNFMKDLRPYNEECYNYYLINIVKSLESLFHEEGIKTPINTGYFKDMNIFRKKVSLYENTISYYSFLDDDIKNKLSQVLTQNITDVLINLLSNQDSTLIVLDFMIKNIDQVCLVIDFMEIKEDNTEDYDYKKLNFALDVFIKSCIKTACKNYVNLNKLHKFLDFFNNINYFYDKIEKYININIRDIFIENLGTKLNENPEMIKKICLIIHSKLKNSLDKTEEEMESQSNILKIISYDNKNKDLFQAMYCKYLIQRLLNNCNINYERKLLHHLQEVEDYNYVRKMQKMVNDIEISNIDLENYNQIKINQSSKLLPTEFRQDKLNLITFSYNVWDIAIKDNMFNEDMIPHLPNQLNSYLNTYTKFYEARYSNKRKLMWLFEMGVIQLKFSIKDKLYKIKANPYQAIVLELFSFKDSIKITEIEDHKALKHLSNTHLKNILNSLLASTLFEMNPDKSGEMMFNNNYHSNSSEISLIDFYNNLSSYNDFIDQKIAKQVAFDREIVLQTNMIHHLKTEMKTMDELMDIMKESKNIYFDVDSKLVQGCLDKLIKKEFINYNQGDNKYSYTVY